MGHILHHMELISDKPSLINQGFIIFHFYS